MTTPAGRIPLRARAPWFAIWVPVVLLLYTLVNGAGHMWVAYEVLCIEPSQAFDFLLRLASFPCGPWGFLIFPVLAVFATVSWKLCPQWSPSIRWASAMLGALLSAFFLLTQATLLFPDQWQVGIPCPKKTVLRICAVQLWKPHLCRPVLERLRMCSRGPAWKAHASEFASMLRDQDGVVRVQAAQALGDLGAKEYAPDLIALLKGPDSRMRSTAASTLADLGGTEYVQDIETLLKDPVPDVRKEASTALGHLKFKADLRAKLKDPDPEERAWAASAIGNNTTVTKELAPDLAALLQDPDARMRRNAAAALGSLRAKEYAPNIAALLKDQDTGVRRSAAGALGWLGAKEYLPQIVHMLQTPDAQARIGASRALSDFGATEFIPEIAALLQDPDIEVRAAAARAIGQLTGLNGSYYDEGGIFTAQAWWDEQERPRVRPEAEALKPPYSSSRSSSGLREASRRMERSSPRLSSRLSTTEVGWRRGSEGCRIRMWLPRWRTAT